jgi:hypothetical protein
MRTDLNVENGASVMEIGGSGKKGAYAWAIGPDGRDRGNCGMIPWLKSGRPVR